MGTNISANLFSSAPAASQGSVQKNVNTAFEGRKTATGKQGRDFSSELKDVTTDDKLAKIVKEAVEKPVAEDSVQKTSELADAKPNDSLQDTVAEAVDEVAEELVAEVVATTAAQMPLAELTTSAQSTAHAEATAPLANLTDQQPTQEVMQLNTVSLEANAVSPEVSTVSQELQQPVAATQLQQQMDRTNSQVQDVAKENVVVNDSVVTDSEAQSVVQNTNLQQPEAHQPKAIEALLKPVQPVEKVTAPDGSQVIDSGDMTKEQDMLAVLSGSRIVSQKSEATEATVQKTTVEDVNNLLGQQVQVVSGRDAKQEFNSDNQQQQAFQQEAKAETMAAPQVKQVESEEPAFTDRMDSAQAVNASTVQNQSTDNVAQVSTQQNVSQTRTDYNITQQIVEHARLIRNAENTEMVIKLNPRHLGDLTLKVAVNSNGGVTATFHTDNAQVRAMLETSMIQLQKELNDQGIKVDSVEVQTGLADGQLPEGQSQGYYQQQAQQSARSQELDLKDFEEDVDQLSTEPVNNATEVIRDSEGNKISDGVDYAV